MTWPWVAVIALVFLFAFGLGYLATWRSNHHASLAVAMEMQMKGPQPFWMHRPPQSLEEMVQWLQQQQPESVDGPEEGT